MPEKELMISALEALAPVQLKLFQGCLATRLLKDFPPLPPHWLSSEDIQRTQEVLVGVYQKTGAMVIMAESLRKIGEQGHIEKLLSQCPARFIPQTPPASPAELNFLLTFRRKLVGRMRFTEGILNALLQEKLLNPAEADAVSVYKSQTMKNRALLDLVCKKGPKGHMLFHQTLSQLDPCLLVDLASHPTVSKSPAPYLRLLLNSLLDEELLVFQMLLSTSSLPGLPPIHSEEMKHASREETKYILEHNYGPDTALLITIKLLDILHNPTGPGVGRETHSSCLAPGMTEDTAVNLLTEIRPEAELHDLYRYLS